MKTPREFLFGKHQAAKTNLDEIRQHVVSQIEERRTPIWAKFWKEMILPARAAWGGIAAGWVIIFALNLMAGGDTSIAVKEAGPMNPDSVIALQRQEQLMAKFDADSNPASPAKTPERRPRSEAPVEYKIV